MRSPCFVFQNVFAVIDLFGSVETISVTSSVINEISMFTSQQSQSVMSEAVEINEVNIYKNVPPLHVHVTISDRLKKFILGYDSVLLYTALKSPCLIFAL